MDRARPSVAGAAIRPRVSTPRGIWSAGLGFAIAVPRTPADTFVSCLHLLGPAGGLPAQVSPEAFFVDPVPLVDAYTDRPLTVATGVLSIPRASADTPWFDVYRGEQDG